MAFSAFFVRAEEVSEGQKSGGTRGGGELLGVYILKEDSSVSLVTTFSSVCTLAAGLDPCSCLAFLLENLRE